MAFVGKQILLGEDDSALSELISAALKLEGYGVESCVDTLAALARIASIQPTIVIIDSELPPAGGLAVVEHLRRKGSLVPIIVLSAENDSKLRDAILEWPQAQCLAKPFSIHEMLLAVARAGQ